MPREDGDSARRGNPGAFIDQELRTRVDGDIAVFLAAFDAALAADTQESRFGLREATDRLLRAGARTRIELERLEARVPLTPRDSGVQADPAPGGIASRTVTVSTKKRAPAGALIVAKLLFVRQPFPSLAGASLAGAKDARLAPNPDPCRTGRRDTASPRAG